MRLIVFILFFPLAVFGQYNTWTKLNDVGMGKRERATGFSIGSLGYLCGGLDTAEVIHKDLWAYDPQTDAWTQKADLPGSARRDAVSFVIDNYAFVGSGMDSISGPTGTTLKDFWRYNPSTNSWSATSVVAKQDLICIAISFGNTNQVTTNGSNAPISLEGYVIKCFLSLSATKHTLGWVQIRIPLKRICIVMIQVPIIGKQ
jgi:N-acetylneuraminic acid mutarotase